MSSGYNVDTWLLPLGGLKLTASFQIHGHFGLPGEFPHPN
jgi:hypothetical protein